ncbi:hypothetical protein [Brachyspira pulli]|uniref:hypothetical protein n=1 Tax=Brachyspira pulli TaxID=310721 RepID=UPI003007E4AA
MQKQIKILLTLLTALILAVSCAENNPNDPNNTTEITITDYVFIDTTSATGDFEWTAEKKSYYESNWKNIFAVRDLYDKENKTIIGKTYENLDYDYLGTDPATKSYYKGATNVFIGGKNYIGGLYYTPNNGYNTWRIIFAFEGTDGAYITWTSTGDYDTQNPEKGPNADANWWEDSFKVDAQNANSFIRFK